MKDEKVKRTGFEEDDPKTISQVIRLSRSQHAELQGALSVLKVRIGLALIAVITTIVVLGTDRLLAWLPNLFR